MARTRKSAVASEPQVAYSVTPSKLTEEDNAIIADALQRIDKVFSTGDVLTDPARAGEYIKLRVGALPREHFLVLFLDTRHRLLSAETLFMGTLDGAEVHPREVVRRALELNAAAVILGHNHPSGSTEPSAADRTVTTRLKQSLTLVEIRLLDHFVVGRGAPVSMAAKGLI